MDVLDMDVGQYNALLAKEMAEDSPDMEVVEHACDQILILGGRLNPSGSSLPEGNVIVWMCDTRRYDVKTRASAAKLETRGIGYSLVTKADVMLALGSGDIRYSEAVLDVVGPRAGVSAVAANDLDGLPFNPNAMTIEMLELSVEDVTDEQVLKRLIALEEGDKNRAGAVDALQDQLELVASLEGAEVGD